MLFFSNYNLDKPAIRPSSDKIANKIVDISRAPNDKADTKSDHGWCTKSLYRGEEQKHRVVTADFLDRLGRA